MTDLADFLLARIAEDEAVAVDANGRVAWLTFRYPDGSMRYTTVAHQHYAGERWIVDGNGVDPQGVAVFYDSRQVLAECDTKRRIVVRCQEMQTAAVPMAVHLAQQTLADLARPYADHPEFDEAWRP